MAKRTVNIQFSSSGIDDITKELQNLQKEANSIKLSEDFQNQFNEIVDKANEVKDAFDDLQDVLTKAPKKKSKNSQLNEMEQKIADIKKAVSSLTQNLAKANQKVDASVAKIETAFNNINSKAFDGLLAQIENVREGFDGLIAQAKDYRNILSSEIQVQPTSVSRTQASNNAKKELNALKSFKQEFEKMQDNAESIPSSISDKKNDKFLISDIKDFLEGLESKASDIQKKRLDAQQRKNTNAEAKYTLELLKTFNQYLALADADDDTISEAFYNAEKSVDLPTIKALNSKYKSGERVYSNLSKWLQTKILPRYEARIQELESLVKTNEGEIENSTIEGELGKLTKKDIKNKTIEMHLTVPEEEKEKVTAEVNDVIEEINNSGKFINIKVNFVTGPTVKNRGKLLQQLEDYMDKGVLDADKANFQNLIQKIDKSLSGDIELKIRSNIQAIEKGVPQAVQNIRKAVEDVPIRANIKVDTEDVQKQIDSLGTLILPIGKIKIDDKALSKTPLEEAKEQAEKALPAWAKIRSDLFTMSEKGALTTDSLKSYKFFNELIQGIGVSAENTDITVSAMVDAINQLVSADDKSGLKEIQDALKSMGKAYNEFRKSKIEAAEVSPSDALASGILKFMDDVQKIPELVKSTMKNLITVDINGKVVVDHKQVQDALSALDDLELRIARLDIYKPTLEKIKLTVKEELIDLIDAEKALIRALNKFNKQLIPNLNAAQAEEGVEPAQKLSLVANIGELIRTENALGAVLNGFIQAVEQVKGINIGEDEPVKTQNEDLVGHLTAIKSSIDDISGKLDKFSDILNLSKAQKAKPQETKTEEKQQPTSLKELYRGGNKPRASLAKKQEENEDEHNDIVSNISENVQSITSILKNDQSNDDSAFSKNVIDWIKGGTIANKTSLKTKGRRDEDKIEVEGIKSAANQHNARATYDRERKMYGNIETGDATPASVTGLLYSVPGELKKALRDAFADIGINVGAHWHPSDLIMPSAGDLESFKKEYQKHSINQQVIVGKKQIGYFDMSVIGDALDFYKEFTEELEKKRATVNGISNKQLLMRDVWEETRNKYNAAHGTQIEGFDKWARFLSFNNVDELSASQLDNFFGIKQNGNSLVTNRTDDILTRILNVLKQIVQKMSPSGKQSQDNFDDDEFEGESPLVPTTKSKLNATWYKGWNKIQGKREKTYASAYAKDLETFKASVSQGDMSDLEYMQKFYNEYLGFLAEDLSKAAKEDKASKKRYIQYVKQQQKDQEQRAKEQERLNKQQLELEKQKNTLVDKENEAQKQAEQLLAERENKQNELAQRYANQQASEYGLAQKKADEEASKARAKGRQQAEKEYIANQNKQSTVKNLWSRMNNFLLNDNLVDDSVRKRVEDMAKRLEQIKDASHITNREFAEIKNECTGITIEAQKNINDTAKINGQLQEQQKIHQKMVEQQRKENQLQTERSNEINKMVAQAKMLRGQQGVSSLSQDMLNEFIHKLRMVQQQGNITKDVIDNLIQESKQLSKNVNADINSAKQQSEQQARQAENDNKARMKRIVSMSESIEKLLKNTNFTQSAQGPATDLLNQLKQIEAQGQISADLFNDIETEFKQINEQAEETINEQKQINDLVEQLDKIQKRVNVDGEYMFTKTYREQAAKMQQELLNGTRSVQEGAAFVEDKNAGSNVVALSKSIRNYITRGERLIAQNYMPSDIKKQLESVVESLKKVADEGGHSRTEINGLINTFQQLEAEGARAGKTLWGQVGQRLQDMNAKFIATYFSFMDIIRYMRSMISTITELDTALTEMRKVSDESIESLKEYQRTTFDTASALGTTAVQLQQSTADWMRLGESMEEAAKSAVAATTLLNVSEFENINEATEALVSMSQAYKDLDKTEIIDVLNNIGNNYSIATDQLATALQSSSAALVTQGNDLYEAAALVTAGNAIIQDANKVGTGIRTISLRIAGVKEGDDEIRQELEELGEEVDDWVVSTEAKKRQVIMDYTRVASNNGEGVDILDSNGNLKNTYTILLEISKIYKEIQEEDKKYGTNRAKGLVEELAGKVRSNIAASILMNPELLENVYESAINSAGSAAEENAKYLDSIVGKTQQFKNELQEVEQNIVSSDVIKDTIDFGTTVLSFLNQIGDKLPTIITLIGGLTLAITSMKKGWTGFVNFNADNGNFGLFGKYNISDLKERSEDVISNIIAAPIDYSRDKEGFKERIKEQWSELFGKDGDLVKDTEVFKHTWENITDGIDFDDAPLKNTFELLGDGLEDGTSFEDFLDNIGPQIEGFNDDVRNTATTLYDRGVGSMQAYGAAANAASTATRAAAFGVQMLNMALTMGATLIASFAIQGLVKGIQKIANASEDATRDAREFSDQLKQTQETIQSNQKYINEISEEYDKLSKGVDSLGNNISLSTDEFDRYNDIANEISSRFPLLVQGWTDEKNAILDTKDALASLNEEYEKNARRQYAEILDNEQLSKVAKNWKQINQANPLEQVIAEMSGSHEAGKYDTYDRLAEFYSTFLDMTYQEYVDFVENGKFDYNSDTRNQEIMTKYNDKLSGILNLSNTFTASSESEFERAKLDAQAALDIIESDMDEVIQQWRDAGEGILQYHLLVDKNVLDTEAQNVASSIINSLDNEFIKSINGDETLFRAYIDNLVKYLGQLDSSTLTSLFVPFNQDEDYSVYKQNLLDAYTKVVDEINKKIEQNPEEASQWRQIQGDILAQSGLQDIIAYEQRFNAVLGAAARTDKEVKDLQQLTEGFSKRQMEMLLNVYEEGMSGTQLIEAYYDELKKVNNSKYTNIGALLSTDVSAGPDWTSARYHELEQEYQKELQLAKETGAELDRTLYGNVDLNNRSVLEWNEENLAKYKDAIESWGDSLEDYAGTVSTVIGTSSEFDGVEIAFTPMLQTPDGAELLDSDTVYRYIDSLISQMPEGWTTEDLLKLDSQGLEIDGKKIKGLIADVGDEAIRVAETMHYLGEDGSLQMLKKEMEAAKESTVTWGDVKDELIGLAQAGKLDEDTLKSYKYYDDILNALGISSEEADERISDMINTINLMAQQNAVDILTNYKTQVDKLDDAYQKFKNNELIDASTLSALQDAFGDMDSFKEFQQAVMEGQTELQDYFDNMVTEYALENLALSEVTEQTKEWTKQNLIAAGITEESAEKSINAVLANKEAIESNIRAQIEEYNEQVKLDESTTELAVSTEDLNKLTAKEVSELLKAANASGTAAQQIALFTLKKELASGKSLRNADDIEYLKELIIQAGVGIELINQLQHLKKVADAQGGNKDEYEAFMKAHPNQGSWDASTLAEYNAKYADVWGVVEFEKTYDQVWDEVEKKYKEMFNYTENVGLGYGGAMKDAAKSASDAAKEFKEALDKILAMYDAELDAGVISFQTYVDKSREIIEQYYRDGKITAQDYYDELASFYEKQVQQYDKVIAAVQKKLSEETDELEKQKENIEKSYNEQIEVIQKKIDALQEENDEIDRNMALSKAQYELARAQSQRTRLLYSESRGFYYEADLKGISEAEENVRKAKTDKIVSEYEKQIKSLQDAMESETKSIDDQIKKLNEYSEAWGKVSSQLEDAQNALRATEVLGPNWETNIKSGLETLNDFTKQYVAAQESQKQAYLAARTAEANNPVGGGSGGTSAPGGGNGGTSGNNGNNGGKTKTTKWVYNGKEYDTEKQAKAAKDDDELEVYESNRKSYINSHSNTGTPEWAMKKVREDADKYAMGILEDYRKNHKITTKTYFSGTDSAKQGQALVGELGSEIVLDKKSGTATFVDSPTLMDMKGGEKVFNAEETEKILKSKYVPLKQFNPKKFAMLHAFAGGTSSPMQTAIAAQAVGIASGLKSGLLATSHTGGQTINQTFNVSLPNITDASKANDLFREFEQLSRKATQYFN